ADLDVGGMFDGVKTKVCRYYFQLIKCNTCSPTLVLGLSLLKTCLTLFKSFGGDFVGGWQNPFKCGLKVRFKIPFECKALEQTLEYLTNFVCPQKIPSEGEVAELYLRGEITKGHAACLLKMHGQSPALIDASFS